MGRGERDDLPARCVAQESRLPRAQRCATLAQRFQPGKILVEEKSWVSSSFKNSPKSVWKSHPVSQAATNKSGCFLNTAPIETGRLRIPQQAPWLKDYIGELITFPRGEYADQVDSTTQALEWIKNTPPEPAIFPSCAGSWKSTASKSGAKNSKGAPALLCSGSTCILWRTERQCAGCATQALTFATRRTASPQPRGRLRARRIGATGTPAVTTRAWCAAVRQHQCRAFQFALAET